MNDNDSNLLDQPEEVSALDTDDAEPDAAASDDPLAGREDLQKALLDLYLECSAEDRYPRLIEVKDVKQAEFYWAGRQYIWWSNQDKQWSLPTQAQNVNYGDLSLDDMPRFEFVTNIYQATGLTVIGAVAGAPPRVRFFPSDADNENDLGTAEGRTKLAKLIQRWNPPQKLLQEETYHAYTGGFVCWWTKYVPDGEKLGFDSFPTLGEQQETPEATITCPDCSWSAPANEAQPPVPCPQCGKPLTDENISQEEAIPVPQDGGEEQVPRGRQVIKIYGALNCKRPQHASHQSGYHYFSIEEEIHYSTLRAAYPDKSDQIKPGLTFGADDVFERNARLSVAENTKLLTQTGAKQANLVTWASVWFRPSAFWMAKDETNRKELLEIFPRGCRAEFGGTTYLMSEAQSMDDAIVTAHAMPGRGQHRPAIGSAMLSIQDRFNTLCNISTETYEYGIPITYRDADTFASEADEDQRAAPGLEVEVLLQPGSDIRQKIMQVRADSVSPDMQKHMMDLMGPITQYISGAFPALSGAGGAEQPETLGQQSMQRDQAMGRMGVFYVNLKQAHADILTLACRDFEAHAEGVVKIPIFGPSGDFESESVDVSALEGDAEAYPEGDENFPELWNQQRSTMMQIMETPYGQALSQDPDNSELFGKLTGIPDLKIPGMASRRKQLKEIAELTQIPQGDELLSGIAPMVEVDPESDDHAIEAQTCKNWLNSEPGQKMKRENPPGWMAVKQHMMKHQAAMPAPKPIEKPPAESINYKDLPPEAQAQWLEQKLGIQVSPQDFIMQAMMEHMKKSPTHPQPAPGHTPPAGPGGNLNASPIQ